MEPVRWLWEQRISLGKLCLVAGEPGLAKSQVTLWLASAVTTGDELPSGGAAPWGSVVILSAEDAPEDTIIPRLKAVGADLNRISISMVRETRDGVSAQRSFDLQLDLPALEKEITKLADVKLIVIDPIASYMGKRVDSHKNAEVRAVLEPVATFAARHKVAVLGVTSARARDRLRSTSSSARSPSSRPRSAFVVTMDPESEAEDRRLFLPVKNNLAKLGHGLAWRTIERAKHKLRIASINIPETSAATLPCMANRLSRQRRRQRLGLDAPLEGALMTSSSKQRAPSKVPGIFEDALVMDVGDIVASHGATVMSVMDVLPER
jgi:AAA domain